MTQFYQTVFVGGGISCLAAKAACRGDSLLLEQDSRPGGLCRSDQVNGFTFDRTGHLLHLRDPTVKKLVDDKIGKRLASHLRDTWIYSHQVYTRYPFQSHFFGLPAEVVADCLLGVFEAYARRSRTRPKMFREWVLQRFGPGVAKHFMFPYNQKLWTIRASQLTTEWMDRFVPKPDLRQIVEGALRDQRSTEGYNAHFWYPIQGGIETLVRSLFPPSDNIFCNQKVVKIDLKRRSVLTNTHEKIGFGRLVSCIPLPALIKIIDSAPDSVRLAAKKLRAAKVYNLNLGLGYQAPSRHWVYLPERSFSLYRFGYSSNFSKRMAPSGTCSVYTETSFRQAATPALVSRLHKAALADLERLGVIASARKLICEHAYVLDPAYVIYDRNRTPAVRKLQRFLERRGIYSIGRFGRWEYSSMEDALLQGLQLANNILNQ